MTDDWVAKYEKEMAEEGFQYVATAIPIQGEIVQGMILNRILKFEDFDKHREIGGIISIDNREKVNEVLYNEGGKGFVKIDGIVPDEELAKYKTIVTWHTHFPHQMSYPTFGGDGISKDTHRRLKAKGTKCYGIIFGNDGFTWYDRRYGSSEEGRTELDKENYALARISKSRKQRPYLTTKNLWKIKEGFPTKNIWFKFKT